MVILTQPMGYVKTKTKNKALPLMRKVYRDYPALLDTLARRQDVYNETTATIREKERRGEVFVIRPEAPWTSSGWTTTGRGSRRCTTWAGRWRKSAWRPCGHF